MKVANAVLLTLLFGPLVHADKLVTVGEGELDLSGEDQLVENGDLESLFAVGFSGWRLGVLGYDADDQVKRGGTYSARCTNTDKLESRGLYQEVTVNQEVATPIVAACWSKAKGVAGGMDNDYSLYLDLFYMDGGVLWGQTVPFSPGTHDWQQRMVQVVPSKPLKSVSVHGIFRYRTGTVWFDDFKLWEVRGAASQGADAAWQVELNQELATPIVAECWSKADTVSPGHDANYALVVQVEYTDGTRLRDQTTAFSPGTHDWTRRAIQIKPTKPIKRVSGRGVFRKRDGKAWFRDFDVQEVGPAMVTSSPVGVARATSTTLPDVKPQRRARLGMREGLGVLVLLLAGAIWLVARASREAARRPYEDVENMRRRIGEKCAAALNEIGEEGSLFDELRARVASLSRGSQELAGHVIAFREAKLSHSRLQIEAEVERLEGQLQEASADDVAEQYRQEIAARQRTLEFLRVNQENEARYLSRLSTVEAAIDNLRLNLPQLRVRLA